MSFSPMNIRIGIFATLFLIFSLNLQAQYIDVGGTVGISLYSGDLSPSKKRHKVGKVNPMGGIFARYNFNNYLTLRAGANYGLVSADDAKADSDNQVERNLSFRSHIIEGNLLLEFNILGYEPYNFEKPWSPYLFAGGGVFHYNPKAKLEGDWIALQPLGTEGQTLAAYPDRQRYSLVSTSLIVGGGIKYALNDTWNIGIEGGIRSTSTDYLDDVSQTYVDNGLLQEQSELAATLANRSGTLRQDGDVRGNSNIRDWYFFAGVTISRNFIDNGLVGSRKRSRKSKSGCPTF